jgi:predicted MFS family arabinose efflux permease
VCGVGSLISVPMLLSIRATGHARTQETSMLRDLRDGWSEFRSHTWLWTISLQFGVVMMAWYGAFQILGPVVARAHLGGPAAWGAITASDAVGLIAGGIVSLRFTPRRPMLFVVIIGAAIAIAPISLAMLWPLPLVCLASFGLGITIEIMMVQWTVTMARNIPPGKLARVSSYDLLGTVMAMPIGALIAGPVAAAVGVSVTQYGAAVLIVAASALALIPRDVRRMRADDGPAPVLDQATISASPVDAAHVAA